MSRITAWAASPVVHRAWMLLSAAGLAAAWQIEPYAFAYATFGAIAVSAFLVTAALIAALAARSPCYRGVAAAATGAVPSVVSCLVLSSVSWA